MGFFSTKLLEGTKNKCINWYLDEIVDMYKSAVRSGFPDSESTLLNIHKNMSPQYFAELEVFLRIKNDFTQEAIDGHFLDAENKALATACAKLNLNFNSVFGLMTDSAIEFAESKFNRKLSYIENFEKVKKEKELKDKSVLWRHSVFTAFKFIEENNIKTKNLISKPIIEKINYEKVKKPGTALKKTVNNPVIEIVNTDKVRKPGTTSQKNKDLENVIAYREFAKRAKSKSQSKKKKAAYERETAWHFSIPINGWSWYCEYHDTYGIADDYDECLFMFGAHMHYLEIDGDVCQPYFKQWDEQDLD